MAFAVTTLAIVAANTMGYVLFSCVIFLFSANTTCGLYCDS